MIRKAQAVNWTFVLGLDDIGLAVARSLGRAGLPVMGLDFETISAGFASRYCKTKVCPRPAYQPEVLVQLLQEQGRKLEQPSMLVPASDEFVLFVSRFRDQLKENFRFVLPPSEVIEALLDKGKQYKLAERVGIPYPATYYPETLEDIRRIQDQLEYPVFVKPYYSHLWQDHFHGTSLKGVQVFTPKDLVERFEEIYRTGLPVLVQSVIPGPDSNTYEVVSYISRNGELLAECGWRKIRQSPPHFGNGTLMESVRVPELAELGRQFLHAIGYYGMSEIEFMRDDRDGTFKFIELNARLPLQAQFAADLGINIPLIQYRDLFGASPEPQMTFKEGIRWLNAGSDFASFRRYYRAGELSPWAWIRSLLPVRSFATFALDDPAPVVKKYLCHVVKKYFFVTNVSTNVEPADGLVG